MDGFVLINSTILGSAAASIVFNTGLTDYTKFRLTLYVITSNVLAVQSRLNGDSGNNYVRQRLNANGSTASTVGAPSSSMFTGRAPVTINATLLQTIEISKPLATTPARYTSSKAYISSEGVEYESQAGEWNNTADLISSITLFASSGNFAAGTRVLLEGAT